MKDHENDRDASPDILESLNQCQISCYVRKINYLFKLLLIIYSIVCSQSIPHRESLFCPYFYPTIFLSSSVILSILSLPTSWSSLCCYSSWESPPLSILSSSILPNWLVLYVVFSSDCFLWVPLAVLQSRAILWNYLLLGPRAGRPKIPLNGILIILN